MATGSYPASSFNDALQTYAAARTAFDRKEYSAAVVQFERTLALLEATETATSSTTAGDSAAGDLALLTSGFLDLSRALAADPRSQSPSSKPRPGFRTGVARLARAALRSYSSGAIL